MSTPFHLDGKKILITGAGSGIGLGTARFAKEMGAELFLTGRNEERLKKAALSIGVSEDRVFIADLTQTAQIQNLIKEIPSLDGLVHCAGVVHPFPVKFLDDKKLDQTLSVNYTAPVLLTSGLLRAKKINSNASIVFISSISAHRPYKGGAVYTGSKAALESYMKTVAAEHFPQGIRSNSISPGMVKTAMYDLTVGDKSEEVAHAVVYLLSSASRWVTGTNLILDGGFLLGT
jgi:predicted outer membrane repeat protein